MRARVSPAQYPFESRFHDLGGLRFHYLDEGVGQAGCEPVVMLHGNPTWGFLYRKVASALLGSPLRIIMPDLIGLGFSDR